MRSGEPAEGVEEEGGRRLVAGEGDIPEDSHAEEGLHIGVVRLCGQGIPEEDEGIELFFGEVGTDLEVAAHGAAQVAMDVAAEGFGKAASCGAGGRKCMWSEQCGVALRPCGHLFLAVVVGDEGNAQRSGHGRAEADAGRQESGKIPGAAVLEWFMMGAMEAWRRRFGCAVRGFCETLGREPSMRVHALAALAVAGMAWWLRVSAHEAAVLALAGGLVMAAEVMNTAVERLADRVCRERDEGIRLAKDAAAGAVLVASVAAAMAGLFILGPKLWVVVFA